MKKLSSKHILLIVLAVILVLFVYYQLSNHALFGKKAAVSAPLPQNEMKGSKNPVKYDVPALMIDLLEHTSAAYDPVGRNLFNYEKPRPSAEELAAIKREQELAQKRAETERKRMEEEAKKQAEIAQQEAILRANLPPPPPPPPPMNFKYLGYIGKVEEKIAVLEEGQDLYFGKEGENVKNDYLILKIDFDSVVVGYNKPEWKSQSRVLPLGR